MDETGQLTSSCVVDVVIGFNIYDDTSETDSHCDDTQGENTNEGELLASLKLQTIDDKEREAED
jgi:hypothetical protein